jgi:hypothetical protein
MQLYKGMFCDNKIMIKKTNKNTRHGENRKAQILLSRFSG